MSARIPRRLLPAFAGLMVLTLCGGCGGSGSAPASVPDPLANPDRLLMLSGRAADGRWMLYALNPDGSGSTPLPALGALIGLDARPGVGIAVNQSGSLVDLTVPGPIGATHNVVRLADGASVFSITALLGNNVAADSTGAQFALAGHLNSTGPYAIFLLKGAQRAQVAAVPAGTTVSEILFAPDDQTLYYVTVPSVPGVPIDPGPKLANGILYRLPPGGSPVAIADIGAQIQSVHTSRDGTKLAFVSYAQTSGAPAVTFTPVTLNADGSGLARGPVKTLTDPLATGFVSPLNVSVASRIDGFHILYVSPAAGIEQIFDMRPDGSGLRQVTFNAGGNAVPASRAEMSRTALMVGGR